MKLNRRIAKLCFHVFWVIGAIALTSRIMGVTMGWKEEVAGAALVASISFLIASSLEGKRYGPDSTQWATGDRPPSRGDLLSLQEVGVCHPDLQPSDANTPNWGSGTGHNPPRRSGLARTRKSKARRPKHVPVGSSSSETAGRASDSLPNIEVVKAA